MSSDPRGMSPEDLDNLERLAHADVAARRAVIASVGMDAFSDAIVAAAETSRLYHQAVENPETVLALVAGLREAREATRTAEALANIAWRYADETGNALPASQTEFAEAVAAYGAAVAGRTTNGEPT